MRSEIRDEWVRLFVQAELNYIGYAVGYLQTIIDTRSPVSELCDALPEVA